MVPGERPCHKQYTCMCNMKAYGKKVMAKVKNFVHASDADADTRAMTLAPSKFVPAR